LVALAPAVILTAVADAQPTTFVPAAAVGTALIVIAGDVYTTLEGPTPPALLANHATPSYTTSNVILFVPAANGVVYAPLTLLDAVIGKVYVCVAPGARPAALTRTL
jgi:hypothetical protein